MRFALKAGCVVTVSMLSMILLPQSAIAAASPSQSQAHIQMAAIPKLKLRMWDFTCGNPVPYQYQNTTYQTGVADKCLWGEAQELAYGCGYRGPVDGVMGPNSWKGFQSWLNANGFNAGAVDGVAGPQTYSALQRLAKTRGDYAGPIDGVMGPNSWKGLGYALNRILYAP